MANEITVENAETGEGTPSVYQITNAYNDIDYLGYADKTSYNAGDTVNFKIDAPSTDVKIYRIGHYDGDNWCLKATVSHTTTTQGSGSTISGSNGATQMAWSTTATWSIPTSAVSGLYIAVIQTTGGSPASWIPFVVRDDARTADIVVGIPTSTWLGAYNYYGDNSSYPTSVIGSNLYGDDGGFDATVRALAVSYDRPCVTHDNIVNHWDAYDLAGIDYLEENGFDVKYVASEDLHQDASRFNDARVYISVGHDEYWSQTMRDNLEAFRDAGGHVVWASGNVVWWRIRYADNERTIWCYKDTLDGPTSEEPRNAGEDLDPTSWTGTWRDTRGTGWTAEPEDELTGMLFAMNGPTFHNVTLETATYSADPLWRDTTLESSNITLTNLVGFEAEKISDPGDGREFETLASESITVTGQLVNANGDVYDGNGSFTWGIVMHRRAAHEGVVVSFGTMGWLHMLSDAHKTGASYGGSARKSTDCRQAMANLLYDLGVSAESLDTVTLTTPTPEPLSSYGLAAPDVYGLGGQGYIPWKYNGSTLDPMIETDYVAP